ncbi:MAG: hypothetical protein ACRDRS_09935, partial [Pseudonocardiaceae bacterium]
MINLARSFDSFRRVVSDALPATHDHKLVYQGSVPSLMLKYVRSVEHEVGVAIRHHLALLPDVHQCCLGPTPRVARTRE